MNDEVYGEVFNIGSGIPLNFIELAKKIIAISGTGKTNFTEFTTERRALEPGDYYADISKINKATGWSPKVALDDGIKKTLEYYRKYKQYYW